MEAIPENILQRVFSNVTNVGNPLDACTSATTPGNCTTTSPPPEPVDTIILGRKMTDGFVSYWSDLMTKPDDPWYAFAKKMIETPKVVFTRTLKKS
jgi:hypothetical protein